MGWSDFAESILWESPSLGAWWGFPLEMVEAVVVELLDSGQAVRCWGSHVRRRGSLSGRSRCGSVRATPVPLVALWLG